MKLTVMLGTAALLAVSACTPAPSSSPLASVAPEPPAKPASKESLKIEFPPAGVALSPTAAAQLDGAARLYRDAQPEVMIVSGHTDKVGSEYANLLLSARRANVVKTALVNRGVPAARLQIIAVGAAEVTPSAAPSREVVVTWR